MLPLCLQHSYVIVGRFLIRFKLPVVKAECFIRGMRGQTRAQFISVYDGSCYVVKFSNNPLGVRILVRKLYPPGCM